MNTLKVLGLVGIPGSGKTTKRKSLLDSNPNVWAVSRDDLRISMFGENYKHSKEKEKAVSARKEELALGIAVNPDAEVLIIDETHCAERGRNHTLSIVEKIKEFRGVDFEWFVIEDSFNVDKCHKRNTSRERSVPYTVIESMFIGFIDFIRSEPGLCPEWLPTKEATDKCYIKNLMICDVDGTIANHEGIRGHFDWDKVDQDLPIRSVINTVEAYVHTHASDVFVFSGRDEVCKDLTIAWCDKHLPVSVDRYDLREQGSMEPDFEVKMRMLKNNCVNEGVMPAIIFDDRQQVCRYWRAMGIQTFQVAAGLF